MNTIGLRIGLLAGCIAFAGPALAVDPVSAVIGLLVMEKVSGPKPQTQRAPAPSWRSTLSATELATLESMKRHPAIGVCIKEANRHNPIAAYQARKIAQFGSEVQRLITATGTVPDVASMDYKRPAKAFRWCGEQAGIVTASDRTSVEQYAYGIVRLVRHNEVQRRMLAARSDY